MQSLDTTKLQAYADAFAFLGNSLLKPMSQTAAIGLDPAFWESFPIFDDADVGKATASCADYARDMEAFSEKQAVENVSVEYTHLFVGPPSPAAAPWETMYRNAEVTVGFGEATFQMRGLLCEADLKVDNENNQYEDHMGLELLFLSKMCRMAPSAATLDGGCSDELQSLMIFVQKHPLSWIDAFGRRIAASVPRGYYLNIVNVTEALLKSMVAHDRS